jgi:uncharacterized protein (DUF1800 family)
MSTELARSPEEYATPPEVEILPPRDVPAMDLVTHTTLLPRTIRRGALLAGALTALRSSMASAASSRNSIQPALSTDRDKIAHLLRRAGFGYSQTQLDEYVALGSRGAVDRLINYEQVPDDIEERLSRHALDLTKAGDMQRWWLLRMIYSRRPLLEKLVLFWHGLLVSGTGKVGLPQVRPDLPNPPNHMMDQHAFFREHALDDFATVMKGISRDPAMVLYLDSNQNRRGNPNENYARELFELFTLGIAGPTGQPNYTEADIREAARAFTGWTLNRERQFAFNRNQHDSGPKTIFGRTGNFNGDDVIDLIMAHPANAYYISKRLFEFFAYDAPSAGVLQPIINSYTSSGGSIRATVRAIFLSPAFYSEQAYRAKVKSPVEYLAGISRALELETNALNFQSSAQRMGQTLFNPPSVAGWAGGAQWFNTTTWLERVNQVNRILTIRRDDNTQPVDLHGFMQRFDLSTPEKTVDYFLTLLVDSQVRPERRQILLDYVKEGNLWPRPGVPARATDPVVDRKVRGLVYLISAMPEFHLA